jgi:transcription initiation factor TFIIF subunit beta
MRQKEPRMHIISESPADSARLKPKIEGLVSQQYELVPGKDSLEQYRQLQGERVKQIALDSAGRAAEALDGGGRDKLPSSDLGQEHVRRMTKKKADGTVDTSTAQTSSSVYNKPAAQKRRDLMVRGDKTDVQDMLFKLFEDNSSLCSGTHTEEELNSGPEPCNHCRMHWTTKDLIKETQQPEQFLKQILKEIAVQIKKGAFQNTWELKQA